MERADQITKAGAVGNVGLAALKGLVGTAAGSPALQADAVRHVGEFRDLAKMALQRCEVILIEEWGEKAIAQLEVAELPEAAGLPKAPFGSPAFWFQP